MRPEDPSVQSNDCGGGRVERRRRVPRSLIQKVRRSHPIRCSALGIGDSCVLRLVLEGESDHPSPLPVSPEATLGRLVHKAFANWKTGTQPRSARPLLRQILEREITVPSSVSESGRVPLRDALGLSRILEKIPSELREIRVSSTEASRSRPTSRVEEVLEPPPFQVSEHAFQSESGELRGRIDLLEVDSGGNAVVTEFKTGKILTEDGEPRESYRVQVEAYGFLLIESGVASSVQLRLIGSDEEWRSEFDEKTFDRIEQRLENITQKVPRGQQRQASELATVGKACRFCSFRPVCSKYRAEAPEFWESPPNHRIPYDTWGKVRTVENQGESNLQVVLKDVKDRLVCVFGVPRWLAEGARPSRRVAFFSLQTSNNWGSSYPQNFEIVSHRLEESAHSAHVLLDES